MPRAKLFKNGRPKEVRSKGDVVTIRREGKEVILEPLEHRAWPKGYWASWGEVPEDFEAPEPLSRP